MGLYWLLKVLKNYASNILALFWMPAVVYRDEYQFENANACHRNIIVLLKATATDMRYFAGSNSLEV